MDEKYYSDLRDLHLSSKKYVLVLPGWYPTWQDKFSGDFNQRHVKAGGLFIPQVVLYVVKDQSGKLTAVETRFYQVSEHIVEMIVIYPEAKIQRLDPVYSNYKYVRLLFNYAAMIKRRWGLPALIHSYIVIRGGLGGMLIGRKWNIPFILSENWTIYYPADPQFLENRNYVFQFVVRLIYKKVRWFLPVSEHLNKQVRSLLHLLPFTVIPNAVDTTLFHANDEIHSGTAFVFIHVSTMSYQKNPEGLLRSFKKFHGLYSESCLKMVGPCPSEVINYARQIGLTEDIVHFTGPVPYNRVAQYVKASQVLVLFSRYENLPCVVLEALCCGLPVISTSVGGIPEVIDCNNGILVESENEEKLTDALNSIYKKYNTYRRSDIAEKATLLYSYEAVGKSINSVYRNLYEPSG